MEGGIKGKKALVLAIIIAAIALIAFNYFTPEKLGENERLIQVNNPSTEKYVVRDTNIFKISMHAENFTNQLEFAIEKLEDGTLRKEDSLEELASIKAALESSDEVVLDGTKIRFFEPVIGYFFEVGQIKIDNKLDGSEVTEYIRSEFKSSDDKYDYEGRKFHLRDGTEIFQVIIKKEAL